MIVEGVKKHSALTPQAVVLVGWRPFLSRDYLAGSVQIRKIGAKASAKPRRGTHDDEKRVASGRCDHSLRNCVAQGRRAGNSGQRGGAGAQQRRRAPGPEVLARPGAALP